jgi:hypothetical protein
LAGIIGSSGIPNLKNLCLIRSIKSGEKSTSSVKIVAFRLLEFGKKALTLGKSKMEERTINLKQPQDKPIEESDVTFKYYNIKEGGLVEDSEGILMLKEDAEKAMNWAMDAIGMVEAEKQQMNLIIMKQQQLIERMNGALEAYETNTKKGAKGIVYGGTFINPDGSMGN